MEFVTSAWHVISATLALLAGLCVVLAAGQGLGVSRLRTLLLYAWHTVFSVLYAHVVVDLGGDAIVYFHDSVAPELEFAFGTQAVSWLTRLLTYYAGFSFLGAFFVFNIFGSIGLLAFDSALRIAGAGKGIWVQRFCTLIILLPSVSFWSAGIGKDAIAFMATALALWANMALARRFWLMALAVAAMFTVRPHMAAMMVLALSVAMLASARVSLARRAALAGIVLAAAVAIVPFALEYGGLSEINSADDVTAYVETRQGYNQEGGGAISIHDMSLPMQLFSYVFRPLPFEASSAFGLAASVDNVVLLLLFALGGWGMLRGRGQARLGNRAFLWSYCAMAWLSSALMTANMGISVRQKWMFLPMLVFMLIAGMRGMRQRAAVYSNPWPMRPASPTPAEPSSGQDATGVRPAR
ncbi:hypothetical protein [Cupriavidus necator]|uniref:hypothetical protein n=1 Tax=Cupriavidus necator TaxID=106590 RepID=UPI00339D8ADC